MTTQHQQQPLQIPILYGSVREARQGIKAARFIDGQLRRRGHATTLIDPMEVRLPLLDRMYKEYPKGQAPEPMERLAALYRAADAFVIVSGEYNHGIPSRSRTCSTISWRSISSSRPRSSAPPPWRVRRRARSNAVLHDPG